MGPVFGVSALALFAVILLPAGTTLASQAEAELGLGVNGMLEPDPVRAGARLASEPLLDVARTRIGHVNLIEANPPLMMWNPPASPNPSDVVRGYLSLLANAIGVSDTSSLVDESVGFRGDGEVEVRMRQVLGEYPVLGSRITVRLLNGALAHFSGRWIPDAYLPPDFLPKLPPRADLMASTVVGTDRRVLGAGLFHGSLFALPGWDFRMPVVAIVVLAAGKEGAVKEFLDAQTGEVLHSEKTNFNVNVDVWDDADCVLFYVLPDPSTEIKLDSVDRCGTGTYPNCTSWPGHSAAVRSDVEQFVTFLSNRFNRTSWDDMSVPECNPDDPNIDPLKCCYMDDAVGPWDQHAMNVAASWTNGDDGEVLCLLQDYPRGQPNSMFAGGTCMTMFYPELSCSDTIGHEFGHAIDYAEKQIIRGSTPHESAMSEAFGDVVGAGFQQLEFPGEGSAWGINDGEAYCSPVRDLSTPVSPEPDHASQFRFAGEGHSNSLVVGHALYLLGRAAGEGAINHYGVSVTGIGMSSALAIFFRAMTIDMTDSVPRSLSNLRNALLSAAISLYGTTSTEYMATRATVDAMGYWTANGSLPQEFNSRPEFGVYGSNTQSWQRYSTVVFYESGYLKYRYRYLSGFNWLWTSAAQIAPAAGPLQTITKLRIVSGLPLGWDLHVFYQDTNGYLRHWIKRNDGQTSDLAVTQGGVALRMNAGQQFRIVSHGGTYRLFYTPFSWSYVYMSDLDVDASTVSSTRVSTSVLATNDYEVGTDETLLNFFYKTTGTATIAQKKYEGGSFVSVSGANTPIDDAPVSTFDVASYMNSVHVVVGDSSNGLRYMRCDSGCDALSEWSQLGPIDTVEDENAEMISLGGYLATDFGLTFARQTDGSSMVYRVKYSK